LKESQIINASAVLPQVVILQAIKAVEYTEKQMTAGRNV
jgi:hypothetical protein